MSDTTAQDAPKPQPPATDAPAREPEVETDWKAEARKWEQRAKDNLARATEHESAAKRLAELEDAQKSEVEKANDRAAKAEQALAAAQSQALRAEVAASKGVPLELIHGTSRDELEAAADALIAFRGEQKPAAPFVAREGNNPQPAASDARESIRALFGRGQ